MTQTFSSLSAPNYKKYFIGLLITNTGTWMGSTAKQWLVFTELTKNDSQVLGNLTALIFAPALFLAPVAGSIADRFPKRTIILIAQVLSFIVSLILTVLVLTKHCQLWQVYLLALLDGCIASLAMPAQQAFVADLVPRNQLSNAIGLNSASFNAARLLGPGLAGALIGLFSTGVVLAINTAAYIGFFVLVLILDQSLVREVPLARGKGQLIDGIKYVIKKPYLVLLLLIAFMMGNFGINFGISNAVMAREAFGKGASEYGILGSIMGIGALTAALWAARRSRPRLRHIMIALLVFSIMSAVSALSPNYWFFACTLVPIGLTAILTNVTANSLLQLSCSDQYRGRVMTIWTTLLLGGTTFISPLVGWIGNAWGPRATVWFEGISIGLTFIAVMIYIVKIEKITFRFAPGSKPWLSIDRDQQTEL